MNECLQSDLNDCHKDAFVGDKQHNALILNPVFQCTDTADSFKCTCNNGFADIDELRQPGHNCVKGNINECRYHSDHYFNECDA